MPIENSKVIKFYLQQFLAWSAKNRIIYVVLLVIAGLAWLVVLGQDKKIGSFVSVGDVVGIAQAENNLGATALKVELKEHSYPVYVKFPKGQLELVGRQVKLDCANYKSGAVQCTFISYLPKP